MGDQKDSIKLPKLQVYKIIQQLPASSDSLHQLRLSMQADDELPLLRQTIMQGWPKSIKQVPPELQPFQPFRDEITVVELTHLEGHQISDTKQAVQSHLETAS